MTDQMAAIDERILSTIDELRRESFACTARGVARRLRMSNNIVRDRVVKMREANLVTWDSMEGSLRRIREPGTELYAMLCEHGVDEIIASEIVWPQMMIPVEGAEPMNAFRIQLVSNYDYSIEAPASTGTETPPADRLPQEGSADGATAIIEPAPVVTAPPAPANSQPSTSRASKPKATRGAGSANGKRVQKSGAQKRREKAERDAALQATV